MRETGIEPAYLACPENFKILILAVFVTPSLRAGKRNRTVIHSLEGCYNNHYTIPAIAIFYLVPIVYYINFEARNPRKSSFAFAQRFSGEACPHRIRGAFRGGLAYSPPRLATLIDARPAIACPPHCVSCRWVLFTRP